MRRFLGLAILLAGTVRRAPAQESPWQRGADVDLIRRAVAHRTLRDADTLVTAWQASAHGILRYATVLDHGDGPVERVIRADELLIEVYGESPNRSKQIITAWRDTSFLPNRMVYHRDHLGIVANDFGATIRLGQGEEVRDLVHPLSDAGLARYQFALGDTVLLTGPAGRVRVVAVRVRPADRDSAGTVGTLFLDVDRAALVRFQFTFTPAAYRDHTVEDITVTLDNALQENARWLPWRQSIVIRRGIALLDFPMRTVIRGDWTINDYQLGVHHAPGRFAGAFIDGPRDALPGGSWDAPLADRLDGLPATEADVNLVEQGASQTMDGRSLDGLPRLRFLAGGISDLIRVNRVEGITPAIGTRITIGRSLTIRGRVGIGLSDGRVIGDLAVERRVSIGSVRLFADRVIQDIADTPVLSGVANSLGALLSGDDYGDYSLVERVGAGLNSGHGAIRVDVTLGWEQATSVSTAFAPLAGTARANPALGDRAGILVRGTISDRDPHGFGWSVDLEGGRDSDSRWARTRVSMRARSSLGGTELQWTADAGVGWGALPRYRTFVLGGRGTLLGVPFRSLGGEREALAGVAWQVPLRLPAPTFPYSRALRLPSYLAPYLAAGIAGGDIAALPWRGSGRIEPVAGLRLDLWGPLLRVDAGIALRTGRAAITLDVHPDWWGLM